MYSTLVNYLRMGPDDLVQISDKDFTKKILDFQTLIDSSPPVQNLETYIRKLPKPWLTRLECWSLF